MKQIKQGCLGTYYIIKNNLFGIADILSLSGNQKDFICTMLKEMVGETFDEGNEQIILRKLTENFIKHELGLINVGMFANMADLFKGFPHLDEGADLYEFVDASSLADKLEGMRGLDLDEDLAKMLALETRSISREAINMAVYREPVIERDKVFIKIGALYSCVRNRIHNKKKIENYMVRKLAIAMTSAIVEKRINYITTKIEWEKHTNKRKTVNYIDFDLADIISINRYGDKPRDEMTGTPINVRSGIKGQAKSKILDLKFSVKVNNIKLKIDKSSLQFVTQDIHLVNNLHVMDKVALIDILYDLGTDKGIDNPIYFNYFADNRGRLYAKSVLSPTASKIMRILLNPYYSKGGDKRYKKMDTYHTYGKLIGIKDGDNLNTILEENNRENIIEKLNSNDKQKDPIGCTKILAYDGLAPTYEFDATSSVLQMYAATLKNIDLAKLCGFITEDENTYKCPYTSIRNNIPPQDKKIEDILNNRKYIKNAIMTYMYGSSVREISKKISIENKNITFENITKAVYLLIKTLRDITKDDITIIKALKIVNKYLIISKNEPIIMENAYIQMKMAYTSTKPMNIRLKTSIPYSVRISEKYDDPNIQKSTISLPANIMHFHDAEIMQYIIKQFIKKDKGIMTIHDAFIVNREDIELLISTYHQGIKKIIKDSKIKNILIDKLKFLKMNMGDNGKPLSKDDEKRHHDLKHLTLSKSEEKTIYEAITLLSIREDTIANFNSMFLIKP